MGIKYNCYYYDNLRNSFHSFIVIMIFKFKNYEFLRQKYNLKTIFCCKK